MNIKDASINLTHQYEFSRSQQMHAIAAPGSSRQDDRKSAQSMVVDSQKVKEHISTKSNRSILDESRFNWSSGDRNDGLTPHWYMIKRLLEAFFGNAIRVSNVNGDALAKDKAVGDGQKNVLNIQGGTFGTNTGFGDGSDSVPGDLPWVYLSLEETEISVVNIAAKITLADGQTVNVLFEERMARHLQQELELNSLEAAKYLDPLAINFGGPVRLSEKRVEFDLNADGQIDLIPAFASNSRYLGFDNNNDGQINDGSELFGALTGDGFAELAVYDDDKNGIIDRNDSVFSRLKVFDPSSGVSSSLLGTGVDSVFLQSISSPFSLTDSGGEALGRVKSTSLYLRGEQAGSIQQIDLIV